MYSNTQLAKKLFLIVTVSVVMAQPPRLPGQSNSGFPDMDSLFSDLDRAFNKEEPTPEEEYFLGRAVAAAVLKEYRPYTADNELTRYLNLICQALVINSSYQSAYNGYHVMVLDSGEPNAFSTPGGHIFITKGLVGIAPSEDALAGAIAHELAHVMLKHGMKMVGDMQIVRETDAMAGRAAAISGNEARNLASFRSAVSYYFDTIIKSGYSQPQEFEADAAAIKLLAGAGYSPGGLPEMLRALQSVQKGYSGGIFSTHPALNERIIRADRQAASYRRAGGSSARRERFLRIVKKEK
jgi:predicted Zn-dependent protease